MAKMYCYLVVSKRRVLRVNTKDVPQINPGEYAFKLNLDIPDQFFERAIPQVNIKASADHLITAPIEAMTEAPPETITKRSSVTGEIVSDHYNIGHKG